MNALLQCLFDVTVVSLCAGLGGFLVFLKSSFSKQNINFLLNVAAGIMLASAFFTLIVPAMDNVLHFLPNKLFASLLLVAAVVCGMLLVQILHHILPHEHEIYGKEGTAVSWKTSWLFVIAIAIHKMPEGLAMGTAYAASELYNPLSLLIGMGLQNVPEGLIVALSLMAIGFSKPKAVKYAIFTGFLQPVGALLGFLTVNQSQVMLPFAMAFAGGIMLFVVLNEVLPETYDSNKSKSTFPLSFGFLIMMFISIIMK